MLKSIGPLELVLILLIVVVLFGSGKISKIGKEFGEAIGLFKKGLKESEEDEKKNSELDDLEQEEK
jgi:sec-independent protein translocase protein TatA